MAGNSCDPQPKGNSAKRARSALVAALFCFAGLQAALFAAIETRWPELRDPLYGRKVRQLKKCFDSAPPEAMRVLLLGSSRTFNGVDAASFEQRLQTAGGRPAVVYNFGLSGAGPLTEWIVLARLLDAGLRADLVLIEVFPAMLADSRPLLEADPLDVSRLWSGDMPRLARRDPRGARLARQWIVGSLVPWHTHRYAVLGRLSTHWLPPEGWGTGFSEFDPHGWQGLDERRCQPQSPTAVEVARLKYAGVLANFRFGPGADALLEIVRLCRKRSLPAALVLMPEGREFASWYSPAARRKVDQFIEQTAHDYHLPVMDARRWMDETQFFDSHHLLAAAARNFSQRLAADAAQVMEQGDVATTGMTADRR
ncbi:MAG TPA: hypothetical protein VJ783_04725 [Pirellulales bacterium]|nr:hypothetical protein [Pirellulales bacterium]